MTRSRFSEILAAKEVSILPKLNPAITQGLGLQIALYNLRASRDRLANLLEGSQERADSYERMMREVDRVAQIKSDSGITTSDEEETSVEKQHGTQEVSQVNKQKTRAKVVKPKIGLDDGHLFREWDEQSVDQIIASKKIDRKMGIRTALDIAAMRIKNSLAKPIFDSRHRKAKRSAYPGRTANDLDGLLPGSPIPLEAVKIPIGNITRVIGLIALVFAIASFAKNKSDHQVINGIACAGNAETGECEVPLEGILIQTVNGEGSLTSDDEGYTRRDGSVRLAYPKEEKIVGMLPFNRFNPELVGDQPFCFKSAVKEEELTKLIYERCEGAE